LLVDSYLADAGSGIGLASRSWPKSRRDRALKSTRKPSGSEDPREGLEDAELVALIQGGASKSSSAITDFLKWCDLTELDRAVLRMLIDGRTHRQMADALGRSTEEIEGTLWHIRRKLLAAMAGREAQLRRLKKEEGSAGSEAPRLAHPDSETAYWWERLRRFPNGYTALRAVRGSVERTRRGDERARRKRPTR
jgi:DNA-binding CsgD family transcriptional regulator